MAAPVPKRLLVIRPDAYGDIVLFEPVLRILREKWSKTEIAVLIQERYADLVPLLTPGMRWLTTKCDPYHAGPDADLESLGVLRGQIAEFAPDCVVAACFDKTWLEAAVAAFTPSARQVSLGAYQLDAISRILLSRAIPVSGTEIYRESVPVELDSSEWDKNLRLARHLTGREVGRLRPQLTVPEAAGRDAAAFLRDAALEPGGFAACCPAGTANVSIKAWPAENFGEVVAWLWEQQGLPTLLLGHDSEKDIVNAVQRAAKHRGANPAVWMGNSGQIVTLAALLHQSQFCFGNDTGPLHVAGALNRPVATIFGGGHWPRFRPAAKRAVCVVQPLPCFGCRWDCHFGDAPCVKTIPIDAVKDAIGRLLSSVGHGSEDVLAEACMTPAELELIAKSAEALKRSRYIHIGGVGGPTELLPRAALERVIEQLQLSEADRAARLQNMQRLEQLLAESERDRAARLQNMQRLEQLLAESERDRAVRLGVIETQGAQIVSLQGEVRHWLEQNLALSQRTGQLETECRVAQARLSELQQRLEKSEADRAARLASVQQLEQSLAKSERDRAAHLAALETQTAQMSSLQSEARRWEEQHRALSQQVGHLEADRNSLQTRLTEVQGRLTASEADRAAREREIDERQHAANEADAERRRQRAEISYLKARGEEMQTALHRLGQSQTYRLMRALGQWRSLDRPRAAATGTASAQAQSSSKPPPQTLRRVVVDLTPVLAGADNGGAKLVAVELVRHLAQLVPSCEWVLLTSEKGHADLASLDLRNVRRVCVGAGAGNGSGKPPRRSRGLAWFGRRGSSSSRRSLVRQLDADVVFCPFTTARFFDPQVPMVTIIHDLQHLTCGGFFSCEERDHRDREFRNVCRFATRIVCVSEYVRGTVLQQGMVDPSRVMSIHTSLFRRLATVPATTDTGVLQRHGLQTDRFLLYPANFWLHKNHEMLLTAFGMYRARHPETDFKLVCTGGLNARREKLQDATERMGLVGHVMLSEFLPNEEFAVLLRACRAMIFPSLCEGFGMPVLEAMEFDKPVLCSNLTSLPEIAGDAALLFDPRKPTEIVRAIEQIATDSELAAHLVQRGRSRLTAFGDAAGMARQYLQALQEALHGGDHSTTAIHGVFSDGWTGGRVTVVHEPSSTQRYLEMTLHVPPWLPAESVSVQLGSSGRVGAQTHVIKREQMVTLRHLLPPASGSVELQIHPTFQPQAQQMGDDTRVLGCLCQSCRILSPNETVELFGREATK